MSHQRIRQVLMDSHWFQSLPENMQEKMIALARTKHLADGQCLYVKGDEADGFYAILDGTIVIEVSSLEGRRAVLAILEKGAWLGEISMFDNCPRLSDAIAKGNAEVMFIPKDKFQALLDEHPHYYKIFISLVCKRYRQAATLVEASLIRSVPERLALRLLDLSAGYGDFRLDNGELKLRVSQEELALLSGSTRQRVNRELKAWESKGWVKVSYGYVTIVDRAALEGLLTEV